MFVEEAVIWVFLFRWPFILENGKGPSYAITITITIN